MKTKLLTISRLVKLFAIVALALVHTSCDETETTDSTGFILHYYGVTDIGPSMTYTLEAPTYKGSAPYDFTITGVTLNDEACTTESFVIDAETGAINIQNTANLATGLYAISVGCYSNGKYFEFKDAIQINMLLAVPEGVTVTPAEVVVKMEDKNWWEASAQVTTDTEKHVSITGYAIAEDESKEYLKYFTISDDGIITFNPEKKDNIIPGEKYVISLKLKTKAGEHLYADAVTFNVISKPLKLQYAPNEVRVEKNIAHESQLPTIQGSSEGRTYTIKSITPEISGFTIDAATGKISIAENTLTQIGNVYEVDVTVTNEYGTSDFPKAYIVTVVDFINPIDPETFKYEVPETYEGKGYTIPLINEFKGDEVIFDFAEDNSDIIKEQIEKNRISIDKVNGTITIAENNTLTPEDYTVKVKAANPKGEVSSSFTLTIKENPNKFTFYYGNNIGLLPEENYANQYAYDTKEDFQAAQLIPTTTLNKKKAKWEIITKKNGATDKNSTGVGATINETTGVIDFSNASFLDQDNKKPMMNIGMIVVKATCGEGDLAYSVTVPIFIRSNKVTEDGIMLDYRPFVFKVNPKTGGESVQPLITCPNQDLLRVDYRRTFRFFDINMAETGYLPENKGSIMYDVWDACYKEMNLPIGTRSKKPMSYYDTSKYINKDHLDVLLGYVKPEHKTVIINPNKWKSADGVFANGVLIGSMTCHPNGREDSNLNSGSKLNPIAIWFDENF